jgi:formyltetrahydrofolate synthetase
MSDKYLPNEIPKRFDLTIYTCYRYNCSYEWGIGTITHSTSDLTGDEYICIAKTPLTVSVPEMTKDLRQMVIDALKAEKEKQAAEHYKRMFELQEKIDSLLQLTYQAQKPIIDETANDLPF